MSKIDEFLKFEKDNNLFDYNYKGVYFWALIRFNVYHDYYLKTKNAHPNLFERKKFKNRFKFFKFIPKQIINKLLMKKKDLFISNDNIYKIIDEKRIDPFTDFFQRSDFTTHNHTVFSPILSNDIIYLGTNDACITFKQYGYLFFYAMLKKIKLIKIPKEIIKLLNVLKHENINISLDYGYFILKTICNFNLRKKFHKKLIQDRFKCIVLVDHYNTNHMSLCSAAQELNIPSIELQHGIIGNQHIAYNFFDMSANNKYLPKYIFTFGNYFNDSMRLPNETTSVSVGYPQMDFSKNKYKNIIKNKKQIIFYSQGAIGDKLSKLAVNIAKLTSNNGYLIKYKLHPSECETWKKDYPHLVYEKNIELLDQTMNVHELLSSAEFHVGVYSTVLIEALAFNGTVFVYNTSDDDIEYMKDFIKIGCMHLFNNENELLNLLEHGIEKSDVNISEYLFKSNAIKNIENEVKKIINFLGK